MALIRSAVAEQLKIRHPVLLAGMGTVANARLSAAVSNAGGLGVIGAISYTPDQLRGVIADLKTQLDDKTAFGVDLALPQVGGAARKTNSDYTQGKLAELVDIICGSGARLFVCAIGVPPRWAVDRFHQAGILVMNMAGHPKHVEKACSLGADIICAQGKEAGGHTGDVASMVLIPQCVDKCAGRTSPLTGKPVSVVAAGGIYDGRTMAAAFALGAEAVWVGTRFVASEEAGTTKAHREAVVRAGASDTFQTTAFSGRPVRLVKTPYWVDWEGSRKEELQRLEAQGRVGYAEDQKRGRVKELGFAATMPLILGQGAGGIPSVLPAAEIVRSMVRDAAAVLGKSAARL